MNHVNALKPPCRTSGSSINSKKDTCGEPGHYAEKKMPYQEGLDI
jgi:hypothetical protein